MMDKTERTALFKAINTVVREYVANQLMELRRIVSGEMQSQYAHFEELVKQIPEARDGKDGRDGKDAEPINRVEFLNYLDATLKDKFENLVRQLKEETPTETEIADRIMPQLKSAIEQSLPLPIDGKNGKDGKDAVPVDYEVIKQYVAAEVYRIPPAKDGKDGLAGKDGASIHPDTIRLMVIDQIGEVISRIPKPENGEPGRDALQIDIIEAEEGKLYSRGTFATWQGGLVRFTGKDWQTIVRGIHTVDVIRAEDLRTFTVRVALTDGEVIEKQFAMPVLLDRGVYRANEEYVAGDTVSHQGSGWVCIAEKTSASPSTPNQHDWRLQIKAGRDGRDVKPTNTFDPVVKLR